MLWVSQPSVSMPRKTIFSWFLATKKKKMQTGNKIKEASIQTGRLMQRTATALTKLLTVILSMKIHFRELNSIKKHFIYFYIKIFMIL